MINRKDYKNDTPQIILILLLSLSMTTCSDLEFEELPFPIAQRNELVNNGTPDVFRIEYSFLGKLDGIVDKDDVSEYGHIWSDDSNPEPTLNNNIGLSKRSDLGDPFDSFTTNILKENQLCPNTTYYYRSYGIIDQEVHYSVVESFTTGGLPLESTYCFVPNDSTKAALTRNFKVKVQLSGYPMDMNASKVGLYWGTKENPRQNQEFVEEDRLANSITETSFEITIGPPSGGYHFQAFIENCEQEFFGNTAELEIHLPWEKTRESLPTDLPRQDAIAFAFGGKGYLGTGRLPTQTFNDFWAFDPDNFEWTKLSNNFGGSQRHSAIGFAFDDHAVFGTGLAVGSEWTADLWEFRPDNIQSIMDLNFMGAREGAVAFSLMRGNGEWNGIVGSGKSGNPDGSSIFYNDFWCLKIENGNYVCTQIAELSIEEAREGAVGFAIDSTAYVGTGKDVNGQRRSDFWKLTPGANTWVPAPAFGGGDREGAVSFTIDKKAYVGLGSPEPSFWEYDSEERGMVLYGQF